MDIVHRGPVATITIEHGTTTLTGIGYNLIDAWYDLDRQARDYMQAHPKTKTITYKNLSITLKQE